MKGSSTTWDERELAGLSVRGNHLNKPVSASTADNDFIADCRNLAKKPGRTIRLLPLAILLGLGTLLFWASQAELEEVTRGTGKVIPSKPIQVIQSLEGGLIEEIFVEEGDTVEQGQPLLRIRDQIYSSSYQENLTKRDVLAARIVRLKAEAESADQLVFPDGIRPDLIELETRLFQKRRDDYRATLTALENRLALSQKEEHYLNASGRAVSKIELTRAKKEAAELAGEIHTLKTSTERAAMEQYDQDRAELEAMELALLRDKDRLDRTMIASPVRGTINKIHINSIGRVISSGDNIMDIVPLDETLLIEADIRPADIAFLHPGQSVKVKFTAYDFAIYGGLEGEVERISVDTIKDDEGESFYQIKVRTQRASLGKDKNGKELEIIPGMVAEVDVLTGKKSVLTYLLKPVNRAREKACRER